MNSLIKVLFLFLLLTQIGFAQWVQVGLDGESIKDIAVQNSAIFAVTSDSGKAYRSLDGGNNWTLIIDSCAIDVDINQAGEVFMLKDSLLNISYWPKRKLFVSSDLGGTWQYINIIEQLGLGNGCYLTTISVSPGGTIFCGFESHGFIGGGATGFGRSTDNGLTWTDAGLYGGDLFGFYFNSILTSGRLYVSGLVPETYIYLSLDEGETWDLLGYPPLLWKSYKLKALGLFSYNGVDIGLVVGMPDEFGFENQGLFLSLDTCQCWTRITTLKISTGLFLESNYMIFGMDSLGVFLFYEGVDSLGSFNEGLSNLNIHAITIDESNNLYLGTDDGLWRRPLSEIVVSAEELSNTLPSSFSLSQNFPNPFNPTTTIQYSIKERTQVELIVYDILGREVEILVNGEQDAGHYDVDFNAGKLASGIYFYRLKAGDFVETKKMLLIK